MTENHPEPNLHKDIPPGLHIMNHVYRCIDTWCQYKHVIRRANLILCYQSANLIWCYQECQPHAPGPLHQVLPQQRTHPCSSQPLSEGLHWSSLLIDEDAQRTWPPTTLQAKLWTQTRFLKCFHFTGKTVPTQSGRHAKKDMEPSLRETQPFGNGGRGWWKAWLRSLIDWASYSSGNDIWGLCIIL